MAKDAIVTGLILAGGQGRRMGGADKSFLTLAGRPLIAHVIARARSQVDHLLINANADTARFSAFGLPVVADCVPGFQGPLAGIFAGLAWSRQNHPDAVWLATFPNDSPFFPADLVARLIAAARQSGALVASATSAGQHHPVFAVWSTAIDMTPKEIFDQRQSHRVDAGLALFPHTQVAFDVADYDPFFNVNTPEDLAMAERLMAGCLR
jgi:molybdopterin-guanine dinucleotide biosynthesis protein A